MMVQSDNYRCLAENLLPDRFPMALNIYTYPSLLKEKATLIAEYRLVSLNVWG